MRFKRAVRAVVVATLASILVACGGGEQVQQPIAFPHKIHAGDNHIPCLYCHSSADKSIDAGIPAVSVCAGCHFPGGVPLIAADKPEVQKVLSYWRAGKPIPWVRIHRLPDYVHFPHKMHIHAGLQCQECHGPVQDEMQVTQFASLRMGWCISCHRKKDVRTDCFVCHH